MSCAQGWRTDRHLILARPSVPALPPASELGVGRRHAPECHLMADGRSVCLPALGARGVGARFVLSAQLSSPARGAWNLGRVPGAAQGLCRGSCLDALQSPRFRDVFRLANAPTQSLFVLARDGGVMTNEPVLQPVIEIRGTRSCHLSPQ